MYYCARFNGSLGSIIFSVSAWRTGVDAAQQMEEIQNFLIDHSQDLNVSLYSPSITIFGIEYSGHDVFRSKITGKFL